MKKILKNQKGFTLVELLVVISIIAILSVVGLTLFNGAQINARDARRKVDLDAIVNALEIKRQPGVVYYKTIVAADMSNGLIPEDTVNGAAKYCIKVYTADDGARTASNPVISDWVWGVPPVAQACPSGYKEAKAGAGNGFDSAVGGYFVDNTNKSFKLCAKLEISSGTVYCQNSAQ